MTFPVETSSHGRKGVNLRMTRDGQPTNERIVSLLETISHRLGELQKAQEQMATDLERIAQEAR
jgi:hypothetical protein